MMSKIGKVLLNILFTIIKTPIFILIGFKKLVEYIYHSLMYSIRRKIAANYLWLYFIVSIITFLSVIWGYLFFELSEKTDEVNLYANSIATKYIEEQYDYDELEVKINLIAEQNKCGIKLQLDSEDLLTSSDFSDFNFPNSKLNNTRTLLKHRMFSDVYKSISPDTGEELIVLIVYPVNQFNREIKILSIFLFISIAFGFIFIWTFGTISNRRILTPLYTMTKAAEKISIHNMDERLDVSKAKYELKDLALTLNEMLDRLNDDYEKQKRFVSDVSHELRTPISIVNGYASMLERWGKKDEEILDESIEAIISEAKNMQVLVENLLTLVRSDNQTLKYNFEEFCIDKLVEEVTKEMQMINHKNQEITCHVESSVYVLADIQMIKQLLRILVDNAVKYTNKNGAIEITCQVISSKCHITIKDSGIGIDKEELAFLFNRFYRSDESRTRETGGHGLGLAIAKVIVLGHSGTIKVKSKKGIGSEFTVIFPII